MRNVTVAVLRQLGFGGQAVAAVMGLTENYVATLHNRALREGLPGIVRESGRPGKLAEAAWARARRWRAEGDSDTEIARRLGVAQSTVFRRLGPAAMQEQLPASGPEGEPGASGPGGPAAPGPQAGEPGPEDEPAAPGPEGEPGLQAGLPEPEAGPAAPGPTGELARAGGREPAARPGPAPARVAGGVLPSRYAGAMLAHGYLDRIGAEAVLGAALPPALARPR
jgi:hypothetical protein